MAWMCDRRSCFVKCPPRSAMLLHGRLGASRQHEPRVTTLRVVLPVPAHCSSRLGSMQQHRHPLAHRCSQLQSPVQAEASCTAAGKGWTAEQGRLPIW